MHLYALREGSVARLGRHLGGLHASKGVRVCSRESERRKKRERESHAKSEPATKRPTNRYLPLDANNPRVYMFNLCINSSQMPVYNPNIRRITRPMYCPSSCEFAFSRLSSATSFEITPFDSRISITSLTILLLNSGWPATV